MQQDFLYYDEVSSRFFFKSRNPNIQKIYGVTRAATSSGYVWTLPGHYPDGLLAVKDFKALLPDARATKEAAARLAYFRSIPDQLQEATTINSLEWPLTRNPYVHQVQILEYLMHYPRLAVLAEQGLGKTFISLAYLTLMARRQGRKFRALVLAPRIVLRNWYEEACDYTDLKAVMYRGTAAQRERIREEIRKDSDWDFIVTNYEAITPIASRAREVRTLAKKDISIGDEVRLEKEGEWLRVAGVDGPERRRVFLLDQHPEPVAQRAVEKARRSLRPDSYLEDYRFFAKEITFDAIIMDEGSRIKGHDSQCSDAVEAIAGRCHYRIMLSGTISLGTPLDVYKPFSILNNTIFGTNFFRFKRKYCEFSPYNKHAVTGFKNLDHLKARIDPFVISRTREECIDLPERILHFRYYDLTPEQRNLYNAIVTQEEIQIAGRTVDVSMAVIKITKLLQVLSGFFILPIERDDTLCNPCEHLLQCLDEHVYPWNKGCAFHDTPAARAIKKPQREYYELRSNPKLELLREDLLETPGKVIIWAYYQRELTHIQELLRQLEMPYILAGEEDCDVKFEKDPDLRVFLGQISQGIGITLNSAKHTRYYSQSLKLDDRLQSQDRNYRIGQTEKVHIWDYLCPDSIEKSVIHLLRSKNDVKDFIQRRTECAECEMSILCVERGIRPYSEKCQLYEDRCRAEQKTKLRIREISS